MDQLHLLIQTQLQEEHAQSCTDRSCGELASSTEGDYVSVARNDNIIMKNSVFVAEVHVMC